MYNKLFCKKNAHSRFHVFIVEKDCHFNTALRQEQRGSVYLQRFLYFTSAFILGFSFLRFETLSACPYCILRHMGIFKIKHMHITPKVPLLAS